jgi:hypothetical protein
MDDYEGDNEDPGSLHKYLYCTDNPVNRFDPTGHDGDEISLMTTMGNIAYMAANLTIRAAPLINRVTVVVFEATTGESVLVGGGAAITGYAAMSRVEGGIGAWTAALSKLKGVAFGPYGYLEQMYSQANHLNQSGAYKAIIKKAAGCVGLDGQAAVKGTEHNQFHAVMEQFWNQFRNSSPGSAQVSNKGYLQALRDALTAVRDSTTGAPKFIQSQIDAMVAFAEKEQIGYGYHDGPGGLRPSIPSSTNAK